jgi:hypothetical protein
MEHPSGTLRPVSLGSLVRRAITVPQLPRSLLTAALVGAAIASTGCGSSDDDRSAAHETTYLASIDSGCARILRAKNRFAADMRHLDASMASRADLVRAAPMYRRAATSFVDSTIDGFRVFARDPAPPRFESFHRAARPAFAVFARNGERIKDRIAAIRTAQDLAELTHPFADWGDGLPDTTLPESALEHAPSCQKVMRTSRP